MPAHDDSEARTDRSESSDSPDHAGYAGHTAHDGPDDSTERVATDSTDTVPDDGPESPAADGPDGGDGSRRPDGGEFTVTPYAVEGAVDYDRLLAQFGADRVTDALRERFPDPVHPLVDRGVLYAHRDLDRFLAAARAGEPHSVVTGRGPSGAMHVGHVLPLYFAKHLQEQLDTTVYVPFSDDEKFLVKEPGLATISEQTRANLRDLLAVGFDPQNTRIVVDFADADVVYPLAAAFASEVTQATFEATYGDPANVGHSFYPAVQAAHLLLPQLVDGRQPTLVPVGVDQDPHVRVCRDVAAKRRYDLDKPGALLSKFLPGLDGTGKLSASSDAPAIELGDDRETVREKLHEHAHSGGRASLAEHREHGGDPEVDVAFQYLEAFFEPDDDRLAEIEAAYRAGDLRSGDLKDHAADRIADFLEAHQARRAALGDLATELAPYRLTASERRRARRRAGFPDDALVQQ